eukprot:1245323-Rhodomonas_salina.1
MAEVVVPWYPGNYSKDMCQFSTKKRESGWMCMLSGDGVGPSGRLGMGLATVQRKVLVFGGHDGAQPHHTCLKFRCPEWLCVCGIMMQQLLL